MRITIDTDSGSVELDAGGKRRRIPLESAEAFEIVSEAWLRYVRYMQTPNRPEFAHYEPPTWAHNLYNVYQALRVRLGRPLHVGWMPWLFEQVADQRKGQQESSQMPRPGLKLTAAQ